jgi:hypothetical protein
VQPTNRPSKGAWDEVIAAVHAWDGDRVIMSHELLGVASARQAQRVVKALRPLDVTIVVTVRDLASTLPSVWQQEIRKGRTWTWADFLAAVRDPDSGPPRPVWRSGFASTSLASSPSGAVSYRSTRSASSSSRLELRPRIFCSGVSPRPPASTQPG